MSSCLFFISIVYTIIDLVDQSGLGHIPPFIKRSDNPFENLHFWLDKINGNPLSSWKAGQNFDIGLPMHYLKKLVGVLPSKDSTKLPYKSFAESDLDILRNEIPESFDAREKWSHCKSLQEVKDQGDCGSCWAVSATSVLTDRFCISTEGRFNDHLSAEDLLSCCKMCGPGCDGGYVDEAWLYLKYTGVVTGGDYNSHDGCVPYSKHPCSHYGNGHYPKCSVSGEPMTTPECKHNCSNNNYHVPFLKDNRKVTTGYKIEPNMTKIQAELVHHGPIQVVYDVYEDFLAYRSGVYKRSLSEENRFVGLHAVKLIGWGVDKRTHLPYWLVQNSWNNDWGDKGLFKIARGTNECNFELDLFGGIPDVTSS